MGHKSQIIRVSTLLLCMSVATGCKEVLYSNLSEREANKMLAVLQASDVSSYRTSGAGGGYDVSVRRADLAVASTLLEAQGLPSETFRRMDEIFSAEGLVGTPFEERVRYIFGLEQKLTENLTSIDGVRSARVSINIPEKSRFGADVEPSSASVIVHHELGFDQLDVVPKVKLHLSNAIPNLEYGDVAVVMFPVGGANVQAIPRTTLIANAEAATRPGNAIPAQEIGTTNATLASVLVLFPGLKWLVLGILVIVSVSQVWKHTGYTRKFNARL